MAKLDVIASRIELQIEPYRVAIPDEKQYVSFKATLPDQLPGEQKNERDY